MKHKPIGLVFLLFWIIAALAILARTGVVSWNWGLMSIMILTLALLFLYHYCEKATRSSKELILIATLAALAALGRVPFAFLPGVQPTTFLVIVSGWVFGPQVGFLVGASSALVSNFFLGQGPWTPWQMAGWGLVGISSAFLSGWRWAEQPLVLGIFGGIWGFLFGWIQNLHFWLTFIYPLTLKTYLATYVSSFQFDLAHSAANFIFCFFLSAPTISILQNFRERLEVEYEFTEEN